MSSTRSRLGWRILSGQLFIAVFTSAVLLLVFGSVTAYSGLAGGLISVAANAIFAIRLFDDKGGWQAEQLTATLYRGLLGKYFLTIALFIMSMVFIEPLNTPVLFAGYLWIQVSPALIAAVLKE